MTAWLAKRSRFHLHFVPTGSSWLNLIEAHNTDPKPFAWTASAESIIEEVNRCRAISRTDH